MSVQQKQLLFICVFRRQVILPEKFSKAGEEKQLEWVEKVLQGDKEF